MNIKITELAKLRPTQAWDWYRPYQFTISFIKKLPVAYFSMPAVEHHQRSGTNWATRVGNGQSHCWLPGSSRRGRKEESRKSYHRIRKKCLLDAWGVCKISEGPWIFCGFLVQIWISDIFFCFVACLNKILGEFLEVSWLHLRFFQETCWVSTGLDAAFRWSWRSSTISWVRDCQFASCNWAFLKTCGWNLDRGLTLGTEMQGMCLSYGSMESFQNNCTAVKLT